MSSSQTPIPFVDLKPLMMAVYEDALADFAEILNKCEFVEGPTVRKLEAMLAEQLQVNHVNACANGTDALLLALQAAGVSPGMKVALPNMTFWATYEAIVQIGAVPVLIDIDPNDLQMSLEQFQKGFEQFRFDAAILVHLFGWCTPKLAEYRKFCQENHIRLIEDGAQAYGVKLNGESIFTGSEIATLSFYPAKVIGGAMDGGAITSRNTATADLIRSLRNHGRSAHYSYAHVGWNSRMGGLQASYLLRICALSETILSSRRSLADRYRQRLSPERSIRLHAPPTGVTENGYLIAIELSSSAEPVAEELRKAGIGCARTYPETLDVQPPARHALRVGDLRESRQFCDRVINLPLYYGMSVEDCDRAADTLLEILHRNR